MKHTLYKWLLRSLVWSSGLVVLAGCFNGSPANPPGVPNQPAPAQSTPAETDVIQSNLNRMSVEEKIGQLIFAGIEGSEIGLHTRELIETYRVGGLILYKPNIKSAGQLTGLVNALKQTNAGNKLPLWLGVDEEGGKVTRLPDEIVKTPSNQEIGRTNSKELAYGIGGLLGKELKGFGLNVNFAPVLDINSNPDNPVIGSRSFGSNAGIVGLMGIQTMKGLQAQRVLPVLKHFPGHGDTSVDSHIGLPVVQNDLSRLHKLELVPFKEAISQQADAVMVAHILLPKIDERYPASMSKKIITDLLRQEMGYKGLVITDDMTMGAIAKNYELGEAAVQSVLAGANVIMVGHDYDKIITVIGALRKAVKEKRIPAEMLDQSASLVMKLKQKYQVTDEIGSPPDVAQFNTEAKKLLNTYSIQ